MSENPDRLMAVASILADVIDELHAVVIDLKKPPVVEPPVEPPPIEEPPPEEEPPTLPPSDYAPDFTAAVQPDGLTVIFSGRNPALPERGTKTDWDFGDGTVDTSGGKFPTHTYATAGVYPVTMRQVNATASPPIDGTITKTVTVAGTGVPPVPPDEEEPPVVIPPVVTPPKPPPPPPPSGNLPVLPVVRTLLLDRAHTDRRANGWDDVDVVKGSGARYVADPLGERGTVLQAPFTQNIRPGTSPIQKIQTLGALGLTEATFAVGLMVDDTFFGNWTGENKQFWLGINSEGNNIFVTLRGTGQIGQFIPGIKIQGIVDPRRESSMNGFVRGGVVPRNKWVDIVMHARMNTYLTPHSQVAGFGWQGDKADGVLSLEVNGQLVDQLTDVNFTQASDAGIKLIPKINSGQLHPTWGGGGNANPQSGSIYYDRLHICGK